MSNTSPQKFGDGGGIPSVVIQEKYLKDAPTIDPSTIDPPTEDKSSKEIIESQLHKLPIPTGYRILLLPYMVKTKSKGGIHLTSNTIQQEQLATTVAYVVELGSDAYKDKDKFPDGAWCKKGDYVLFGRYAGAKITMQGEDGDNLPLRLLNDDEILAVIDDPEDYIGVL